MPTGISWTDETWNPVRGCSAVSPGCAHCYAEQQAARIVRMGKGKPTAYDGLVELVGKQQIARWTGAVRLVPEHLADPLRWRKPRRIFVNSMSDLFHEALTNEQIAAVFGVMAAAPQHTFQVLTKRAERMRDWFRWVSEYGLEVMAVEAATLLVDWGEPERLVWKVCGHGNWPLPNVWLGTSVEDQPRARERIPNLLETRAAVRFLSCEPLLGPLNLNAKCPPFYAPHLRRDRIGWVIAGCESGPGARPADVAWFRSLRDQCAAAGVPFFLKQAHGGDAAIQPISRRADAMKAAGQKWKPGGVLELPLLDGVMHAAFPEVAPRA